MRSVAVFVLMILIIGCSSGGSYQSNPLNHTYVTSTQEMHSLTGLNITHEVEHNPNSRPVDRSQVNGIKDITIFIDGREVFQTTVSHNLMGLGSPKTGIKHLGFIQLPPGDHKISVVGRTDSTKDQNLFRKPILTWERTVTLEKGQVYEARAEHSIEFTKISENYPAITVCNFLGISLYKEN